MSPRRRTAILLTFALSFLARPEAIARPLPQADAPDETRDKQIMERFKAVLERTPRRGTALDRVYGYHVERGTLDTLIKSYRDRVAKDPTDGVSSLLVGLLEAQRGKDAEAVAAFREAEKARPNDPLPCYYLGQALVLVGRPDDAAEAFERALARKPIRADLLEIFQALGRVHQRAHRPDKALAVWSRLEKVFPDDLRVQEQIAAALAEEEQPEQALERYLKLSDRVTDSYRKIQLRLEAAAIRVRLGKSKDALADFEGVLGRLDPDSWIARDVRRKIEEVFLRRDDLSGLASYYQAWIEKTPDDIEAMTRLGRTLVQMARFEDARKWYDKAVKLAPRRKDLRLAFIDLLRKQSDFAAADKQYEELNKNDPSDPDVIREWGRMRLTDTSRTEADRKTAAAEVWRKLVPADAKDPIPVAQAAELFRQAGLVDDAVAYFKKAVELAPDAPQYREYLGEYYHSLKRSDEALAVWRESVQGKARTAKNLGRLGEVLAGFGYRKEALEPLKEAIALEPDDLDLRLKKVDVLLALQLPLEAEAELAPCEKLASDDEQREAVLSRTIRSLQDSKTLGKRIAELIEATRAEAKPAAVAWSRLARYLEADGKAADAAVAAARAVEADPKSIPAWKVLARLQESTGRLLEAAETYRKLVALDRRSRTDYLTEIAKLEARLGRREQALQAGRDLIAAAPGNPEHDEFFSNLCFQLGEVDEGLESLRRSVRANPSDPKIMLTLAENLARQFRAEEAIELYWRAFDKTNDLDGKLDIIGKMTEQYLQRGQFERLLARIERELREQDQQRERSLCLAAAHQAAGDLGTARQEVEKLLGAYPKDLVLLRRLSLIAETSADFNVAAQYQARINEAAPSEEGDARLATLYLRVGEVDKAAAIWTRTADDGDDSSRVVTAIDSLISTGKKELAAAVIDSRLRRDPRNWELLARKAVTLIDDGKRDQAFAVFQTILDLNIPDDTPSAALAKPKQQPRGGTSAPASNTYYETYPPAIFRQGSAYTARGIAGLDGRGRPGMSVALGWVPRDYGWVRLLAVLAMTQRPDAAGRKTFEADLTRKFEENRTDPRVAWDFYYLAQGLQLARRIDEASRRLAALAPNDLSAQFLFLQTWSGKLDLPSYRPSYYNYRRRSGESAAVGPEDLEALRQAALTILRARKAWYVEDYAGAVVGALEAAGRKAEASELLGLLVDSVKRYQGFTSVANLLATRRDLDGLRRLAVRYQAEKPSFGQMSNVIYNSPEALLPCRILGVLAEKKDVDASLKLWDDFRALRRRARAQETRLARPGSANLAVRSVYSVQIYTGATRARAMQLDSSFGLDSFGPIETHVLYNLYQVAKEGGWLDRLEKHLASGEGAKSDPDRVDDQMALLMIHWWNDDRDQALVALRKASALLPASADLALALAELHARRGEYAEALAALDKVDVVDQKVMQKKESAALRLAVRLGDIVRARSAAERLFGLRLDSNTQVELASMMSRLGMFEMSDAVLNRAQRDAGGRSGALISLMYQFLNQGKTEQAVEAAFQVLRQSPPPAPNSSNGSMMTFGGGGGGVSYALNLSGVTQFGDQGEGRRQALAVLARTGRLREMIARTEAQRAASPNSAQTLRTLIEYYNADNRPDLARKVEEDLAKLQPDDQRGRMMNAVATVSAGKADEGLAEAKKLISAEPTLGLEFYGRLGSAASAVGKYEAFLRMFESMDLDRLDDPGLLYNLAIEMVARPETRSRGIALEARVLQRYPSQRLNMLYNILPQDYAGEVPGLYEALKSVLVTDARSYPTPWYVTDLAVATRRERRTKPFAVFLLEAAARDGKFEDLEKSLAEAIKTAPEWSAGRALIAALHFRQGKTEEARREFDALIQSASRFMTSPSRTFLIDELESNGLANLAAELSGRVVKDQIATIGTTDFDLNTYLQTAQSLAASNRKADAVALYSKLALSKPIDIEDEFGSVSMFIQTVSTNMAAQLFHLRATDEALEALRYARRLLSESKPSPEMESTRASLMMQLSQTVEGEYRNARAEDRTKFLTWLLGTSDEGNDFLDPKLEIMGTGSLDSSTLSSGLERRLRVELVKEDRDAVGKLLRDAEAKRPESPRPLIALAILRDAEGNRAELPALIRKTAAWAETHPLPPAATGRKADVDPAVADQTALWLVARIALAQAPTRADGKILAERALAAARRLSSPAKSRAILRDWGDLAFRAGDKAEAERLWTQLLDSVASPPKAVAPGVGLNRRGGASRFASGGIRPTPRFVQAKAAAPAVGEADTNSRSSRRRFTESLDVAQLAASRGMKALSFRAVREAFANGPPVDVEADDESDPFAPSQGRAANIYIHGGQAALRRPLDAGALPRLRIGSRLNELERAWTRSGVPAAEVYPILRDIALPASNPNQVLLFIESSNQGDPRGALGIGTTLVTTARDAKKLDEIVARVKERSDKPGAELSALVLLSEAARLSNDPKAVNDVLKRFNDRLQVNRLQNTLDMAVRVALPALEVDASADDASIVLDSCLKAIQKAPNGLDLGDIGLKLARHEYRRARPEAARARLEAYLEAQERIARRSGQAANLVARRTRLEAVGFEVLKLGRTRDAMDYVGRAVDLPIRDGNTIKPEALALLIRRLALLPDAERFEMLSEWTLPTKDRSSIRLAAKFVPEPAVPSEFHELARREGVAPIQPPSVVPTLLSTEWQLIRAAKAAGKLDALAAEVKKLADIRVENAEVLHALIQTERGDFGPAKSRLEEFVKGSGPTGAADEASDERAIQWLRTQDPNRFTIFDMELTARCLSEPSTSLSAERVLSRRLGVRESDEELRPLRRILRERRVARLAPGSENAPNPLPAGWRPVGPSDTLQDWILHEGLLARIDGPASSRLVFHRPLTGRFEITGETRNDPGIDGVVSIAGASTPEANPNPELEESRGFRTFRPAPGPAAPETPIRFRIVVEDDQVTTYSNGVVVDRRPRDRSEAWLKLGPRSLGSAQFRRLAIQGTPEFARSVDLLDSSTLSGWTVPGGSIVRVDPPGAPAAAAAGPAGPAGPAPSAAVAGRIATVSPATIALPAGVALTRSSTVITRMAPLAVPSTTVSPLPTLMPTAPMMAVSTSMSSSSFEADRAGGPRSISPWVLNGGVLYSERDRGAVAGKPIPSSALWTMGTSSDEVFTYEFLYEPGATLVHPRVGPLAFKLGPEGVAVELVDATAARVVNLSVPASVPCPGAKAPALKAKEWNSAAVTVKDGTVAISINGNEVVNGKFDVGATPAVGFHHDQATTQARIRNVVIKSSNTDRLTPEAAADLLRPAGPSTDPSARRGDLLTSESERADDVAFVIRSTRTLPARERFEKLAAHVLPGPAHATLRLNSTADSDGRILDPAGSLVAAAVEAGLVDRLAARLKSPRTTREEIALGVSVDVAAGKTDDARKGLDSLREKLAARKPNPDGSPSDDLAAEFHAARAAMSRPELRESASALIAKGIEPWSKFDRVAPPSAIRLASLVAPDEPSARLSWFVQGNHAGASARVGGVPARRFHLKDGAIRLAPGAEADTLILRIPLTGDFDITAELSGGDRASSVRLVFGGIWLGPNSPQTAIVKSARNSVIESSTSRLPSGLSGTYKYRLVRQGNRVTAYVQDKPVGEHRFEREPIPWLEIEGPPLSSGSVKFLSFTAKGPESDSLELVKNRLIGFTSRNGPRTPGAVGPIWTASGNELSGTVGVASPESMEEEVVLSYVATQSGVMFRRPMMINTGSMNGSPNRIGAKYPLESHLRFQRALGEGETFSFESFVAATGRVDVAPTFGRTAYLASPAGFESYRITDAPFGSIDDDRSAPAALAVPKPTDLKPAGWVRQSVARRDGKVVVTIGDRVVSERKIEPGEETFVGLFHFTGDAPARARGVTLSVNGKTPPPAGNLLDPAR